MPGNLGGGADKWRNPDEDLPADFDGRRVEHYAALRKPIDASEFIEQLQHEMRTELDGLNVALIPASGSRRGQSREHQDNGLLSEEMRRAADRSAGPGGRNPGRGPLATRTVWPGTDSVDLDSADHSAAGPLRSLRDGSRSHNMAGAAGRYWAGVWRRAVEASGS